MYRFFVVLFVTLVTFTLQAQDLDLDHLRNDSSESTQVETLQGILQSTKNLYNKLPEGELKTQVADDITRLTTLITDLAPVQAETKHFIRVLRDSKGEMVSLDTELVRYQNGDGVVVDLISAVHVGEKAYYNKLNKQFLHYDALLYELVGDEDSVIPVPLSERSGNDGGNLKYVMDMQKLMQNVLGLEHQLNEINYTADNFVHADLYKSDLDRLMKERGDTQVTMMLETLLNALRQQNNAAGEVEEFNLDQLLQLFLNNDPSIALRRLMAASFDNANISEAMGQAQYKLIVKDRNDACVKVLKSQLANENNKTIGIFYGAAHMDELQNQLKDLGFHRTTSVWLKAWNLQ